MLFRHMLIFWGGMLFRHTGSSVFQGRYVVSTYRVICFSGVVCCFAICCFSVVVCRFARCCFSGVVCCFDILGHLFFRGGMLV